MLTNALIINALVLFAVLEADLGRRRKVGLFRLVRPLLLGATIVPMFLQAPATHGTGLALEIGGGVAGVLLGLAATGLMSVRRDSVTGRIVSRSGWGYAALWITVIGARSLFSIGSAHWFNHALTSWAVSNQVTGAAITDTLVIMAVAMTSTRTLGLGFRTLDLRRAPALAQSAA